MQHHKKPTGGQDNDAHHDPHNDAHDDERAASGDRDTLASGPPSQLPGELAQTIRTGAAFNATWRLPAIGAASASSANQHESGVRKLDIDSSRQTWPSAAPPPASDAPPSPVAFSSAPPSAESFGKTLLHGVAAVSAPASTMGSTLRGVAAFSVEPPPRTEVSHDSNHRNTDPMGFSARPATPPPPAATQTAQPMRSIAAEPVSASQLPRQILEASDALRRPFAVDTGTGHLAVGRKSMPALRTLSPRLVLAVSCAAVALAFFALNAADKMDARSPSAQSLPTVPDAPAAPIKAHSPPNVAHAAASPSAALPVEKSAPTVVATEVASLPAGAEVIRAGAVVANTPTTLKHTLGTVDYLLRMPGYQPEVVRISEASPAQITVTLKPVPGAPQ